MSQSASVRRLAPGTTILISINAPLIFSGLWTTNEDDDNRQTVATVIRLKNLEAIRIRLKNFEALKTKILPEKYAGNKCDS